MSFETAFNCNAKFYTLSATQDTIGGWTETYSYRATAPAYITYLAGGLQVFAGKKQVVATHRMFCNYINCSTTDKIMVAGQDKWYSILYIDECRGHHLELLLEVIEEPEIVDESSSSSEEYSSSSSSSSEEYSSSSSSSSNSSSSSSE